MMKKINLFWYKHPKGKGNFGDELNPYIIGKISGEQITHINLDFLLNDKLLALKIILVAVLQKRLSLAGFFKYLSFNFFSHPKVLLAIGSVLQKVKYSNCQVWGSGIIEKKYNFKNADFLAVRGKYSQQKLSELGYKTPEVIGDPAVLLPMVYQPKKLKKYKVGIIPHFVHFEKVRKLISPDILVINLLDDIEEIIDQICSCEFTLSTSLHGIIVSHIYGIPSLWTDFKEVEEKLHGDNIKFKDYLSSVELNEYEAFLILTIKDLEMTNILEKLREKYQQELLPDPNVIAHLQRNLLKVAPFTLKKEYQNYIK